MATRIERQALVRSLVWLAVTPLVMGVLLFWPAGTFSWPRGWWFIAAFVTSLMVSIVALWRLNPEIFRRSRQGRSMMSAIVAAS